MKRSTVELLLALGTWTVVGGAQPRMLNVGDARIRFEATGQGQALVFIHGWAQSLAIWDDQVREFTPRYRVVRFDRRGFGESTGYADDSADPADVRALLDSLGIRSAHVVGLSGGASAALNFAVAFPERASALVLYGLPPLRDYAAIPAFPRARDMFGELARQHGMDSVRRALSASPIVWVPPGREDLRAGMVSMIAAYSGRDLLDPRPESGRVPHARWQQLAGLRVPTLIVNGDHDLAPLLAFADSLRRQVPNARQVVIKDGGHGAHFAQPQQFNSALLEFFASISTARPQ
ncbi:MAG: alpha/beta fold hydrolase [Gemmatimonadaceae bacterium]